MRKEFFSKTVNGFDNTTFMSGLTQHLSTRLLMTQQHF